jgi:predicted outer membrane repeat protein
MDKNTIVFIWKTMLIEILLFCLLSPSCASSNSDNIQTRDVTLAWESAVDKDNNQLDLAGYYLYYMVDDSSMNSPARINIQGTDLTNYTIHGLDLEKSYVFWVTAYDIAGLESGPSEEVRLCRAFFRDKDEDGDGDPNNYDVPDIDAQACSCPSGYVENQADCDDSVENVCPIHIRPGQSIQTAIKNAHDGDVIVIDRGTYQENIDFMGKAITVKSTNPDDPAVVAGTILDGSNAKSVVTFSNGEGSDSILNGITVQNGKAILGGGIYCASSPTIINCTMRKNSASFGGGIYCTSSSVAITNCTIRENSAIVSGGIYCSFSPAAITRCTISKNSGTTLAGGIYCIRSSVDVTNCIVSENSVGYGGGGINCTSSSPSISNTTIHGNSISTTGGGIYCLSSNPTIINCIISGNSAKSGGGIYDSNSSLTITNCLFGKNSLKNSMGDIFNSTPGDYCNINDGYTDNISGDPLFVDPGGDFHLQHFSPCIDKGTSEGAPQTDRDGHPRPVGWYDIGAYEFGVSR